MSSRVAPTPPATPTAQPDVVDAGLAGRGRRMLAPPDRRSRIRLRRSRGRCVVAATLIFGLAVLFVGGLALGAAEPPTGSRPVAAAQPAPPAPTFPTFLPTTSAPPTSSVRPTPCLVPPGQPLPSGCIPPPVTTVPGPVQPGPGGGGGGEGSCDFWDPSTWLDCLFRGMVTDALNPLLDLMGRTLLTTPHPSSLPAIGVVWTNSFHLMVAGYAILVALAGIVLMAHESVQTRYSIKEIAPRLVVGFLAGVLSMMVAGMGIQVANSLARAVMGQGLDPNQAAGTLKQLVLSALNGGVWILFIGIILIIALIALLISYVLRVAITVILIGGAPLALMFHALAQTEGIAFWWWRAIGGCLAIQIAQSLTLVTALRVFLAPGGFTLFGPTPSGLVNLLVTLALTYILFKVPFWILSATRLSNRRSFVGGLAKAYVAGKAFGLLSGHSAHRHGTRPAYAAAGSVLHGTAGTRPRRPDPIDNPRWIAAVARQFSPEQIGARLEAQRAAERARAARRPRAPMPQFQQPSPQTPTHDLAAGSPSAPAAAPEFRSGGDTPPPTASQPIKKRTRPTSTQFRAPSRVTSREGIQLALVPPRLRFQPPTPEKPIAPVRATAPAAPAFRPATSDTPATPARRARTHTPAPVRFQPPKPRGGGGQR